MSLPFKKRSSRILISFTENKQFLKPTIYQVQKKSPEFVPRRQEADDRQNNYFNNSNGLYIKYLSPFRMELFIKCDVTISKMSCSSPYPTKKMNHEPAANLNFKTKFENERFTFLNFGKRGGIAVNKRWCSTYC